MLMFDPVPVKQEAMDPVSVALDVQFLREAPVIAKEHSLLAAVHPLITGTCTPHTSR